MATQTKRVDSIDLLRGLAIFFVLMLHVNIRLRLNHVPWAQNLPRWFVDPLVWNGQRGVQMFFAVSGFLITSNTLKRWGSPGSVNIPAFYRLRFARIAPLLLAVLGILTALHLAGVSDYVIRPERSTLGRALLAALTFHVNWLEAHHGYLPGNWDVMWSLSVEEMFYLFFPLVCRIAGRWLPALLLVFVAMGPFARTVWSGGNEVWSEYSYLGGMDAIALGCLTALVGSRLPKWLGACMGAAVLGVSLLAWRQTLWFGTHGLDMTLIAVGTCLVMTARDWQAPLLLRPLLKLGQRSYEVYLTHMFVVFSVLGWFLRAGKPGWGIVVFFVSVPILAGLLGEAVGRWFSDPANLWLRSVSGRSE